MKYKSENIISPVENVLQKKQQFIKTVKAVELKIKLGFNQLDPIMTKQQSIGLKIKKTFPNKEIIEDFYVKEFD